MSSRKSIVGLVGHERKGRWGRGIAKQVLESLVEEMGVAGHVALDQSIGPG
jgi:hypothetical protein